MTRTVWLPIVYNHRTFAWEARCGHCGKLAYYLTDEAIRNTAGRFTVPQSHDAAHTCHKETK